jgi:hypothetical protein
MIDTMQQIASDIHKMRRSSSVISIFDRRRLHELLGDQLQKDSKSWLCPPDPSENYNIGCKIHRDGTATWFFKERVFDEWNAASSLLWIYGKRELLLFALRLPPFISHHVAGSGKTILL